MCMFNGTAINLTSHISQNVPSPLFFLQVIYRRYASLFFIVGTKPDVAAGEGAENTENELGMLEFIHNLVETMDKWAGSICEVRASKQDALCVVCQRFQTSVWQLSEVPCIMASF
jgi:hypothetical protein